MNNKENDAILSITSDGKKGEIKIKTPPGSFLKTNSTKAYMKNIKQETTGGDIMHDSKDLTQIGGSQTAKNKGKITNRVENGKLYQENVNQSAENKGEIVNEVKKN